MMHAMLLFLSGSDMIVIAVIALFLFGGSKIPQFARGLGESIKHFKDSVGDKDDTSKNDPNKKA